MQQQRQPAEEAFVLPSPHSAAANEKKTQVQEAFSLCHSTRVQLIKSLKLSEVQLSLVDSQRSPESLTATTQSEEDVADPLDSFHLLGAAEKGCSDNSGSSSCIKSCVIKYLQINSRFNFNPIKYNSSNSQSYNNFLIYQKPFLMWISFSQQEPFTVFVFCNYFSTAVCHW